MKTLIAIVALLFSTLSLASNSKNGVERGAVLSMKGRISICNDARDLGSSAYKLLLPTLEAKDEGLNFKLFLTTKKCNKVDGKVKWVIKDMEAADKIIIKDFTKHILKINGYILNPKKLANGVYKLQTQLTTKALLKKKELKKLSAGKTIIKKLSVFYGNHNYWSDGEDYTTYKDSTGWYKLVFTLKKNEVTKELESKILKFSK